MIDHVPDEREMMTLLGARLLDVWERLCAAIEERYEMECRWNSGGKAWTYERKYRRAARRSVRCMPETAASASW